MAVHASSKTPFVRMPRRYRRKRFEQLRADIAQDPNGRGVFTSHHMLPGGVYHDETYDASHRSLWADFYFLSQHKSRDGLLFNATVRTVEMAVMDAADDYMYERIDAVLTSAERQLAYPPLDWSPRDDGLFELVHQKDAVFERLGGGSLSGLRARFLAEFPQHMPAFHTRCELDISYRYGVGAHFTINAAQVNLDVLAGLVEAFWAGGEKSYQDELSVDLNEPGLKARVAANLDRQVRAWQRIDLNERGLAVPAELEDPIEPSLTEDLA